MKRPVCLCNCGDHAWVILTRGMCALLDPEFQAAASKWDWHASFDGKHWSARRKYKRRVEGTVRHVSIYQHHMVLPPPHGFVVDHINGNSLDNRSDNLRLATDAENATNKRNASTASSRYRGVCKIGDQRWQALITKGGKQIYLGSFDDEAEAALAYDRAALTHHGEWARLNFPSDQERAA